MHHNLPVLSLSRHTFRTQPMRESSFFPGLPRKAVGKTTDGDKTNSSD